ERHGEPSKARRRHPPRRGCREARRHRAAGAADESSRVPVGRGPAESARRGLLQLRARARGADAQVDAGAGGRGAQAARPEGADRGGTTMIEVRRLGQQIGVEITGVDVKMLDDAGFATIYKAWLDYNVAVVPGQELEIEDFLRYSRRFGIVHPHPSKMTRHPD